MIVCFLDYCESESCWRQAQVVAKVDGKLLGRDMRTDIRKIYLIEVGDKQRA